MILTLNYLFPWRRHRNRLYFDSSGKIWRRVNGMLDSLIWALPLPRRQTARLHAERQASIIRTSRWMKARQTAAWLSALRRCVARRLFTTLTATASVYISTGVIEPFFPRAAVTHTKFCPNFPLKRGGSFTDRNHAPATPLCKYGLSALPIWLSGEYVGDSYARLGGADTGHTQRSFIKRR